MIPCGEILREDYHALPLEFLLPIKCLGQNLDCWSGSKEKHTSHQCACQYSSDFQNFLTSVIFPIHIWKQFFTFNPQIVPERLVFCGISLYKVAVWHSGYLVKQLCPQGHTDTVSTITLNSLRIFSQWLENHRLCSQHTNYNSLCLLHWNSLKPITSK